LARTTVCAFPLPLCQGILTQQVPLQFAMLVFQMSNVRVLHLVGVKTADFDRDLTNRQERGNEAHSLDSRISFGVQRGRQPASRSASIIKARLRIAAKPTSLEPVSTPTLAGCTCALVAKRKRMVKGSRRTSRARFASSHTRARRGVVGIKGFPACDSTN